MKLINPAFVLSLSIILFSCNLHQEEAQEKTKESTMHIVFTPEMANYLYQFAYNCIDQEYPNKPGVVLGDESYLQTPREMHPAFYGCFDWHSAVHGHWTLVNLLRMFPDFEHHDSIMDKLKNNITKENIEKEVAFFMDEHNSTFQRTYGWAWLLKLAESLREWDHPDATELYHNIKPLEQLLARKFIEFLNVLNYPIRTGEHPNTAFGMSFAYDYAVKYHPGLAYQIERKAKEYYIEDYQCPLSWEPGGFDFLSPCLQQASLMLKVIPLEDYKIWLHHFLPGFQQEPEFFLEPAEVTDPSDGKLAHLDGLNFSRAWCLFEMGTALENEKMITLAKTHFDYSYAKLDTGEYAGSHWLASFALHAILKGQGEAVP